MLSAMVLGAGFGTRLRPLTEELPKPLLPVGDAPLLVHIEKRFRAFQIERAVVNTHYRAGALAHVELPLPTTFVHEPVLLGTAGGLANALPWLGREEVLVWNGDILADIDIAELVCARRDAKAIAAWSVVRRPKGEGTVGLDDAGALVRVRHFQHGVESHGGDFLGVQVLGPEVLRQLPAKGCLVEDVLGPLLCQGRRIITVEHRGPWDHIGTPASYLAANLRWLEDTSYIGPQAKVGDASLHQVVVGRGATVQGEGSIERVVIWPHAWVQAPLCNAIVMSKGRVFKVES